MIHQCYFYFSDFQLSYLMIERMSYIPVKETTVRRNLSWRQKDNFFLFFISWFSYLKTDRKQLTLKETTESWNLNNCKRSFLCMTTSPTTTNRIGIYLFYFHFSFFCMTSAHFLRSGFGLGFLFLNLFLGIKFYSFSNQIMIWV